MLKKSLKIVGFLSITLMMFMVGSCSSSSKMRQRTEKNLPVWNKTPTNGKNLYPSIIRLNDTMDRFFCTGFVIDGVYAMTAAHCVVDMVGDIRTDSIKIHDQYDNYVGEAIPVAVDRYLDVAFIKGNFEDFKAAPVDFRGINSKTGMVTVACGFPSGQYDLYCVNLVQVGNKDFRYRMSGGPLFKGMSGGPVVEVTSGNVIGINSSVDTFTVVIAPVLGSLDAVGLK